jgi:hypothetical protein
LQAALSELHVRQKIAKTEKALVLSLAQSDL